jgi:hypothetical protein
MCRVWKAPATDSGRSRAPAGGSAANASSCPTVPAATIWPAPFTLAGVSPAADGDEPQRVVGAERPGDGPGGQLTDAVAGGRQLAAGGGTILAEQGDGGGQARGDQERLSDRRVPDLVGAGRGAVADEVASGPLGPGAETFGHAGHVEPR